MLTVLPFLAITAGSDHVVELAASAWGGDITIGRRVDVAWFGSAGITCLASLESAMLTVIHLAPDNGIAARGHHTSRGIPPIAKTTAENREDYNRESMIESP